MFWLDLMYFSLLHKSNHDDVICGNAVIGACLIKGMFNYHHDLTHNLRKMCKLIRIPKAACFRDTTGICSSCWGMQNKNQILFSQ